MEDGNILSGGMDELNEIRRTVTEYADQKEKNTELTSKKAQLEKEIRTKEKQLADKIASVTKARRTALERDYDGQTDAVKSKMRKVRSEKEKQKSAKVSERIAAETSGLREEKKRCREEIKGIYAVNKMPRALNNDFIHALCLPQGIKDILIILLTLVITLIALPCGVYFLLLPRKIVFLVVTYIITVLLFGGLYLLLCKKTREEHPKAYGEIRALRGELAKKQKEIRRIEKRIHKDKDESGYELEKFNKELGELDKEIEKIAEKKKEALKNFEAETKKAIAQNLSAEASKELGTLKDQQEEIQKEQHQTEERLQSLATMIADRYSAYLGKENLDLGRLDDLGRIMEAGGAATIGEALVAYQKGNSDEGTQ